MSIPRGNPLKITVTFVDQGSVPFDPDHDIAMDVKNPDGSTITYQYPSQLTRESTGVYSVVVAATEVGTIEAQGRGVLASGLPVTSPKNYENVLPN